MEQSHFLSCSCSQSTGGHWAGSPIPALNPSFPVSQVKSNCIAPCPCSSHRGLEVFQKGQRTGLDFSALVNQGGALFDKRKGVSIFWQHLCTENTVSVAVPPHITAPFFSQGGCSQQQRTSLAFLIVWQLWGDPGAQNIWGFHYVFHQLDILLLSYLKNVCEFIFPAPCEEETCCSLCLETEVKALGN